MKLYRVKIKTLDYLEENFFFGEETTKKYIRAQAQREAEYLTRIRGVKQYHTYIEAITPMSLVVAADGTLHETSLEAQVEHCVDCGKELNTDNIGAIYQESSGIYEALCQECAKRR